MSIGPFDFEIDVNGACVVAGKKRLHSACLSDENVDLEIKALKADLDLVAVKMKAAIKKKRSEPLFGGKNG